MKITFFKIALILALAIFCLVLITSRSANAGWNPETRVNIDNFGKQASRGADCPWSISIDNNDRVHVVWEDRRQGRPLRIYYRGKDPDPTWNKWDSEDYELSIIDSVTMFGHPSISPQPSGKLFSVYVEEKPFGGELFGSWISNHPSDNIESDLVSNEGGNYLTFSSTGWQTTIAVNGNRSITFWPYVDPDISGSLPIYYKIYENDMEATDETPIMIPGLGMEYMGINLSSAAGGGNNAYLACRLVSGNFPEGHIFLITINIKTGLIINTRDLTPGENRRCSFPYIAVVPLPDGNDIIYVAFELGSADTKAVFISNRSGLWSEKKILTTGRESSGRPCLAINGANVDFVYESPGNKPNSQIYHQRYNPPTDQLTQPVLLTGDSEYYNKRPVIASDSYGNIHVIFITNRENPERMGDEEVYYLVYDAPPAAPSRRGIEISERFISWENNREPDISHYEIEILGTRFTSFDNQIEIDPAYKRAGKIAISAIDFAGQSSEPAVLLLGSYGKRDGISEPVFISVGPNYPNPFNANTAIPVSEPAASRSMLEILDITGRVVSVIEVSRSYAHSVLWDGTDNYGRPVSSGTYFYRLNSDDQFSRARKMTLIR